MATLMDTATVLRPVNPATLEPVGTVAVTRPGELDAMIVHGRDAQARWAEQPLSARRSLIARVGRALLEAADEATDVIVAETGKPVVEAFTSELFPSLDACRWLSRNLERALRPTPIGLPRLLVPQKRGWQRWDPCGVAAIVAAWNYPLGVPLTQAVTAVAAGDAVIVKPSELTPLTGAWIEQLFRRAGAPEGLVQVAQGAGETIGDQLITHEGIDHVVFTGSVAVGTGVAVRCAEALRPVTLELGGKDPMLVLDDADLTRAVGGALWGAFTNAGQVCSGIERAYVAAPVFEAFVDRLADATATLRLGRGDDPLTQMGPLITEEQRSRVEALVADAVEHGADVVVGGGRPATGLPGWFHEPTVIVGEPSAARIASGEIFGPVLTVVKIDDESDGIERANGSSFGLGASVWSRDRARAGNVARRLRAGSVWMNDHAYSYGTFAAPWGGVGSSGYGRTHAVDGLRALSVAKYVDRDAGRLRPPWWYPYTAQTIDGFRAAATVTFAAGGRERVAAAFRHRRAARSGPLDEAPLVSDLSHVDDTGAVRMVDVGAKPVSHRRARAKATVAMAPETASRLRTLPKGDALTTAQIAGIMAAKRTSELVPLCHPLSLSTVAVELTVGEAAVEIVSTAETTDRTGVEMEALVAATVAALTVYDMAKAIDKGMVITDVTLIEKTKAER